MSSLGRGLLAGAVGTTVLNLVTYADMAVRGRPASQVPAQTVQRALDRVCVDVPGSGSEKANRSSALGALAGLGVGTGVGAAVSVLRSIGLRLSPATGSVSTAAVAMVATDGPAAVLGVSDPREWSAQDWVADAVPHLAYGVVTHGLVRGLERREATAVVPRRPSGALLLRSLLIGVASGSRSSLGLAGAAIVAPSTRTTTVARWGSIVAVGAELVADKHPRTLSRLGPQGLVPRFLSATAGATALSARERTLADLPVAVAWMGVAVGSFVGAGWRETELVAPTVAAVLEDGTALSLAVLACRRPHA